MTVLWLAVLATVSADEAFKQAYRQASRLEDCNGLLETFPQRLESYECYWRVARRNLRFNEGTRLLEAMLAEDPENHRARFYLGAIEKDRYTERAVPLMREALAGFQRTDDFRGEFWAHIALHFEARSHGEMATAESELAGARRVAKEADDPLLVAEVSLYEAWFASHRAEYTQAWVLFRRLETNIPPKIRRDFVTDVLDGLADTSSHLGLHNESLDYYRRELTKIREFVVPSWEADILYRIAIGARKVEVPRRFRDDELLRFDTEALDAAIHAEDRRTEGNARLQLGSNPALPEAQRLAYLEEALALLREVDNAEGTRRALILLARARLEQDPELAFRLVDESIQLARAQNSPEDVARAWIARAEMRWQVGEREAAIDDSRSALEALEALRSLQGDRQIHARVLGRFAFAYRRLSGHLLAASPSAAEIDLALGIVERMRARVLLGAVHRETRLDNPEMARLRRNIARVQKRLIDPGLSGEDREGVITELEQLEIEVTARAAPDPVRVEVPTIAELQNELSDDQALLAFQVDDSQSWLIAVTSERATAHKLPPRDELDRHIQLYIGLINRRDGAEREGASLLYEQLLGDVELPATVRRLVILPDGPLHLLPMSTLRPQSHGSPLATSFQISVAPSAALWLRWQRVGHDAGLPALALADPLLPGVTHANEYRAAGMFRSGLTLGRLRHARDEAAAVIDRLGGRLFEGDHASEHLLKSQVLHKYGLLHLAAHAIVDDRNPHRSAIVLAPGSPNEDGLLQFPEIAELDMEGLVVILSTCSSAHGEVLEGEGVMSLSRAFFQAGASAVVGNLWPLRDDEAAELIDDLSRHLADGATLGAAIATTQREWIAADKPAASWAGLLLQGDADLVLFPGGRASTPIGPFVVAGLVVLGLIVGGWAMKRWRRHRVTRHSSQKSV